MPWHAAGRSPNKKPIPRRIDERSAVRTYGSQGTKTQSPDGVSEHALPWDAPSDPSTYTRQCKKWVCHHGPTQLMAYCVALKRTWEPHSYLLYVRHLQNTPRYGPCQGKIDGNPSLGMVLRWARAKAVTPQSRERAGREVARAFARSWGGALPPAGPAGRQSANLALLQWRGLCGLHMVFQPASSAICWGWRTGAEEERSGRSRSGRGCCHEAVPRGETPEGPQ